MIFGLDVHLQGTFRSTPDLRLAIFVDICFWHGCSMCYSEPKTSVGLWLAKVRRN